MTPTPSVKRGPITDDEATAKKKRTNVTYIVLERMQQILLHHLQDHDTFDVGAYLGKSNQKDSASASEVLDWAPTLIEILKDVPSGVVSIKSLTDGFEAVLRARPLSNPFMGKRLCCFSLKNPLTFKIFVWHSKRINIYIYTYNDTSDS
jgi:hypothetical protein